MTPKKRIIDHTGMKKYSPDICASCSGMFEDQNGEYIKIEDFESLIRKLGKPEVLQKVIKSVMFGSSDNFDLALLLSAPDQEKK